MNFLLQNVYWLISGYPSSELAVACINADLCFGRFFYYFFCFCCCWTSVVELCKQHRLRRRQRNNKNKGNAGIRVNKSTFFPFFVFCRDNARKLGWEKWKRGMGAAKKKKFRWLCRGEGGLYIRRGNGQKYRKQS